MFSAESCFFSKFWLENTAIPSTLFGNGKGKAIPLQAWIGPDGFQEAEAPIFQDSRHMKVIRLSALRTSHQEIFLVLISVRG